MATNFDNILSKYQYWFRKGFGSQQCVIVFVEKWNKIKIEEADFSKVYDCLLHNLHIAKLLRYGYGFDMLSLKWIYTYLSRKKNRVKSDSYNSWKKILFDIPQGSILGQLLFNIFICDLFLFKNDMLCCWWYFLCDVIKNKSGYWKT